MLKNILLLAIGSFGLNVQATNCRLSTSDTAEEKAHISYSFGTSIPTGKFGSTDYYEKGAGYAKTGIAIELNLTHKIHGGPYSWCISSRSIVNQANEMALVNDMNYASPGSGYDVQWGAYSNASLLAGAKYNFKATDKIYIVPRLMMGIAIAGYPEMLVRSSWNTSFWYRETRASGSAFSNLMGLGLDARISRNMKLLANLDFQQAFPLFVGVEQLYSNGTRELHSVSQRMNTLNITIGLAAELK
jgi:hypothetical protein